MSKKKARVARKGAIDFIRDKIKDMYPDLTDIHFQILITREETYIARVFVIGPPDYYHFGKLHTLPALVHPLESPLPPHQVVMDYTINNR